MRVVAISDLHGWLPGMNSPQEIPECDLLLIGGDVMPVWNHEMQFQREWLDGAFRTWLTTLPAKNIVGIGGNHDFYLRDRKGDALARTLPWTYLNNETTEVNGLKIWGSPYSNKYGNWAFMKKDDELAPIWDTIPRDSDIVLVHGPPWGFGDEVVGFSMTKRGMLEAEHVGSTSLANQLFYDVWENLQLVVFGHIHEGYGQYQMKNVKMLNVSQMDDEYKPVNPPMVIDL